MSKIDFIRMHLAFDLVITNLSDDIWVCYCTPFSCSVVCNSSQHISLSIQHPLLPGPVIFSFGHAKCSSDK